MSFVESDVYDFKIKNKYDFCICEATLRHMNKPLEVLENMKETIKDNGLVVCVEINREIENVSLYVDGIKYNELCRLLTIF